MVIQANRLSVLPCFLMDHLWLQGLPNDQESFPAKEAETRALLFAPNAIKDCRFSKVRIHMDAVEVVRSIKGSNDWSIQPRVGDILKCLKHFGSFETVFIPRYLNGVAHYLAKCGQFWINFIWPHCK